MSGKFDSVTIITPSVNDNHAVTKAYVDTALPNPTSLTLPANEPVDPRSGQVHYTKEGLMVFDGTIWQRVVFAPVDVYAGVLAKLLVLDASEIDPNTPNQQLAVWEDSSDNNRSATTQGTVTVRDGFVRIAAGSLVQLPSFGVLDISQVGVTITMVVRGSCASLYDRLFHFGKNAGIFAGNENDALFLTSDFPPGLLVLTNRTLYRSNPGFKIPSLPGPDEAFLVLSVIREKNRLTVVHNGESAVVEYDNAVTTCTWDRNYIAYHPGMEPPGPSIDVAYFEVIHGIIPTGLLNYHHNALTRRMAPN